MHELDLKRLTQRLVDVGIAPKYVRRAVNEVRDHYDDLVDAAIVSGLDRHEAQERAGTRIGRLDDLVEEMAMRRELKTWVYRFPRTAILVYPLACLAALPAVPINAGVMHAPVLARWGASLLAAGLFTAALLLVLQLSILFG